MIGQKKLLATLDRYTLQTLPKTILFIGEEGSGKRTVIKYLADKFDIDLVQVPTNITPEILAEYQQCVIQKIYYIDLSQYTQKEQNQVLKFIEEPSKNTYIMLSAETEALVLPTVLNRCLKLHMDPYTEAELKFAYIASNDLVYKLCTTPGQIRAVDTKTLPELYETATKVVTSLDKASYVNTLTLTRKINYKEEYDKFDFKLFLRAIEHAALTEYIKTRSEKNFRIYQITNTFEQELVDKKIAKENFMTKYLTVLWQEIHG